MKKQTSSFQPLKNYRVLAPYLGGCQWSHAADQWNTTRKAPTSFVTKKIHQLAFAGNKATLSKKKLIFNGENKVFQNFLIKNKQAERQAKQIQGKKKKGKG